MMNQKYQQGAVLIVSLILLLAITVIALGSLDSSTLGTKMVVNALHKETTFQEAESAIEQTLDSAGNFSNAISRTDTTVVDAVATTAKYTGHTTSSATVTYRGKDPSRNIGTSLEQGGQGISLAMFQLEVKGRSSFDNSNTSTTIGQGVELLARY